MPAVTVYSERGLSLEADGVRQVVCEQPEAAYRYTGLKLLLQSGVLTLRSPGTPGAVRRA